MATPGGPPPPTTTRLVDPTGTTHDVPADAVPSAIQQGWTVPTEDQRLSQVADAAREADYGGVGGAAAAGITGLARGATLGGSDVLLRAAGGGDNAFDLRQLREENPGISKAGDFAGTALLAGLTGGAGGAGAAAGEGGALAAEAGGGLAAAIGRSAARGAAEGAVFGAGAGVSDLALEDDPLTWEHAASTIGSNVLFGAATGGVIGAGAKGVGIGLSRAKSSIDRALARGAAEDAIVDGAPDIRDMTVGQLQAARKAEVDAVRASQAPARDDFVTDLATSRELDEKAQPWRLFNGAETSDLRKAGKESLKADIKIRNSLENRAALNENPEKVLDALQRQNQAYRKLLTAGEAELAGMRQAFDEAPAKIRQEILDGKVKGENASGLTKAGLDSAVEREISRRYGAEAIKAAPASDVTLATRRAEYDAARERIRQDVLAGKIKGENPKALTPEGIDAAVERVVERRLGPFTPPTVEYVPEFIPPRRFRLLDAARDTLERNEQLMRQLEQLRAEPASPRLGLIDSALEAAKAPKESPVVEKIIKAIPFSGPLAAVVELGGKARHLLGEVTTKVARRAGEAASTFLGPATKAAKVGEVFGPVAATKLLEEMRYAPPEVVHGVRRTPKSDGEKLARAYEDRTAEIKAMTAYDATGTPRLRMDARQAMAAQLTAIRPTNPILADRIETIATRRIEYLSSIIPRQPEIGGAPLGPDDWRPSDMQVREFARAAAALEDPAGVLERAAQGVVVPEEIRAIAAVYPEMLASWTRGVLSEFTTLRTKLPIARRVSLSLMTGMPVDPSMAPHVMSTLQSQYQYEPQPERAQPQFGSVKNKTDIGTPSERREEGTGT